MDIYSVYFQDSYFVRCILPNNEKNNAKFEHDLVLKQLITSSTISYVKFIRFGYPKRIELRKIVDACEWLEKKLNIEFEQRSMFYSKVLLYIGFKLKDFKMGHDAIFFRSKKFHLLENFLSDLAESEDLESTPGVLDTLKRKPK